MLQLRKQIYSFCFIFLGMVTAVPFAYAADTQIGIVNTAKLLIVNLQKSIKVLEDKLSKDAAIMSEAARKKQEREIVSKKRDVKRVREEFTEDFNFRRNEEIGKLQKLVFQTILSLAKEKKYDIILNESVIYASQQVDITANVLERLRELYKKNSEKK